MLAEFQQALADLTASPELCINARKEPAILLERYELTNREWRRLVGLVNDKGMQCACIVYRANRLAPLALNLPETCKALGSNLRSVASEFWNAHPETNVHFFIETDRFCNFLEAKIAAGHKFTPEVIECLAREHAIVFAGLTESYIEGN